MKWIGRVLSLLAACIVVPVFLFFAGAYLVGFAIVMLAPLATGSVFAAALVAIPGLVVLDRTRAKGRRPAVLLGGLVGLASGVAAWLMMGEIWGLVIVPIGIPYGILGAGVYSFVNGWFENSIEQAAANRALARLPEEERRELVSRMDRDSW